MFPRRMLLRLPSLRFPVPGYKHAEEHKGLLVCLFCDGLESLNVEFTGKKGNEIKIKGAPLA
jgi:hypothetical protein